MADQSIDRFREYATSTAFTLTLSRPMIEMLWQMDHYGETWGQLHTAHALVNRGLAEWVPADVAKVPRFRITDAGRAVLPLLALAGLKVDFPEIPAAVDLPEPVVTLKRKEPIDG